MMRELGCTFKNITNMVRNIFLYLINKARKRSEKLGVHLLILTDCIFLKLREGTLLCYAFSWIMGIYTRHPKGQLILKAIYGLLTSPKKWTDEFVLFAFLLFTANKSNSSVRFLGESTARQSAFWFYLTFNGFVVKIP